MRIREGEKDRKYVARRREKKHGLYPRHLVRADDKSPSAGTTSAMGKNEKERMAGGGEGGGEGPS